MPGMNVSFVPPAEVLQHDFRELGLRIRSFREPLERSVRQVVSPSFRQNFQEGGRPAWAPLSEATIANKSRYGYPLDPLVRTGTLMEVAGQLNLWSYTQNEAYIESIPDRASYGIFHQTGTQWMPAREWAVIQDEDLDAIQEVFEEWLDEKLEQSGF